MSEIALIEAVGLTKSFGGVHAVRSMDFAVFPGEVHALVGENGAGKSTLVKMLSGILASDAGEIRSDGVRTSLNSPADALDRGVHTIHQELELLPTLSIAENVFLGMLPARGIAVDRSELRRRTQSIINELAAPLDPNALIRDLYIGDRQVVEIAKALVRNARVLIMDEPTAALPPVEAGRLMEVIARLRNRGVGIVYVSHKLEEILKIADRITVMRDGAKVAEVAPSHTNRETLVSLILGHDLTELSLEKVPPTANPIIRVSNLSIEGNVEGASFEVRPNEIVGFFGLLGAGQSSIAEALFGCRPASAAHIAISDVHRVPKAPGGVIAAGIGYVPSDRKGAGLALSLPIWENLLMADLGKATRAGIVRRPLVERWCRAAVDAFDIRCNSLHQKVGSLSGGNQQKVVLGRWHDEKIRFLLLDEPTRGVDVGAKAEIYRLLDNFSKHGGACLIFSSDAEEVAAVCSRAYAMRRGEIVHELGPGRITAKELVAAVL